MAHISHQVTARHVITNDVRTRVLQEATTIIPFGPFSLSVLLRGAFPPKGLLARAGT